ncbi:MAG TPA: hypothetical protein VGQ19_20020 [Burkholderiales bacterium]|nr:hypothetical protein [Burkholderiales bacterium]
MKIEYLQGDERQKSRSFSPAVITEGGRIVWFKEQIRTGSALITVSNLARPGCVIEIQGIAVVPQ